MRATHVFQDDKIPATERLAVAPETDSTRQLSRYSSLPVEHVSLGTVDLGLA